MNVSALNCQACYAPLNLENTKFGICSCEYCGTQHNLDQQLKMKVGSFDRSFLVKLVGFMNKNMNLQDVADLTFTMSGDNRIYNRLHWDDIRHTSLSCATRELATWCQRRGCLDVLVEYVVKERPMLYVELL